MPTTLTSGIYQVGKDMAPGKYKIYSSVNAGATISWLGSTSKDDVVKTFSGEVGAVEYVEIKETDVAIRVYYYTIMERVS